MDILYKNDKWRMNEWMNEICNSSHINHTVKTEKLCVTLLRHTSTSQRYPPLKTCRFRDCHWSFSVFSVRNKWKTWCTYDFIHYREKYFYLVITCIMKSTPKKYIHSNLWNDKMTSIKSPGKKANTLIMLLPKQTKYSDALCKYFHRIS